MRGLRRRHGRSRRGRSMAAGDVMSSVRTHGAEQAARATYRKLRLSGVSQTSAREGAYKVLRARGGMSGRRGFDVADDIMRAEG